MISRFFRHIRDGFVGVKRHFGNALSSIAAVTITLLLIGVFVVLFLNIRSLTEEIEGSISLSVLLNYEVDGEQREVIKSDIEMINGVESVEFRSKDDEFDYYVSQYSDEEDTKGYKMYPKCTRR